MHLRHHSFVMLAATLLLLCSAFCQASTPPPRVIVLPDMGRETILNIINKAKTSIDLEIYLLTDNLVIDALINAQKKGVNVRILLEGSTVFTPDINDRVIKKLQAAGVKIRPATRGHTTNHQKSITIDNKFSYIMTFNFVTNSFSGDMRNFAILVDNPEQVQIIANTFDYDWRKPLVDLEDDTTLVWSPINARPTFDSLLNNAKSQLDLYISYNISDINVIRQLQGALKRGVTVRILITLAKPVKPETTKALTFLNAIGADIRVTYKPKNHAKAIISDPNDKHTVLYIGSTNMTRISIDCNRELGLLTDDLKIIKPIVKSFDQDWQQAKPYSPAKNANMKELREFYKNNEPPSWCFKRPVIDDVKKYN